MQHPYFEAIVQEEKAKASTAMIIEKTETKP